MSDRRDLASGHDHVVFGSVADDPYEHDYDYDEHGYPGLPREVHHLNDKRCIFRCEHPAV